MPTAKLFNMAGDQVGEVALSEAVFGVEPNESVLHDSVKNHLANCRQGTQSALTRAEVSGGGRKPWRQKGTGHARQGSTRSPQWTHGGVALGPVLLLCIVEQEPQVEHPRIILLAPGFPHQLQHCPQTAGPLHRAV